MSEQTRPTTVTSWHIEPGKGVFVNGELFPYYVHSDGAMVEQIPDFDDMHILWMPLVAEGPAPRAGRPDAEPVTCGSCPFAACPDCAFQPKETP